MVSIGGETVAQLQRAGLHGLAQGFAVGGCGPRWTARRLAWYQGGAASVAVKPADSCDRICATAHLSGDGRNRLPRIAQQDDQTVSIDYFGTVGQAKAIQLVPLCFGEFDTVSHGFDLQAAPPPLESSAIKSELYTGTPNVSKTFDTIVLPLPIPPVNPTLIIISL